MLVAIVAFLIFLFIAVISGTITFPTSDELILVVSSLSLLVISWIYSRERRAHKGEKKEAKEEK